MPDITMCSGEGCPDSLKSHCYRFLAEPSSYGQSYFLEAPFHQTSDRCNYFEEVDVLRKNFGMESKQEVSDG